MYLRIYLSRLPRIDFGFFSRLSIFIQLKITEIYSCSQAPQITIHSTNVRLRIINLYKYLYVFVVAINERREQKLKSHKIDTDLQRIIGEQEYHTKFCNKWTRFVLLSTHQRKSLNIPDQYHLINLLKILIINTITYISVIGKFGKNFANFFFNC